MSEQLNCNDCKEITKTPVNYFDKGRQFDTTYEAEEKIIYDCKNITCPIKQARIRKKDMENHHEKETVQSLNEANGVDIALLIQTRKEHLLTSVSAAKLLGMSATAYSDVEHQNCPFPLEQYNIALQKFNAIDITPKF